MMYEVGGIVNKLLLYKPMSSLLVNHLYLETLMHSASVCSKLPHNRTKHEKIIFLSICFLSLILSGFQIEPYCFNLSLIVGFMISSVCLVMKLMTRMKFKTESKSVMFW